MDTTKIFLFLILGVTLTSTRILDDYQRNRTKVMEEEFTYFVGANLQLNKEETLVNDILMTLKDNELTNSFYNSDNFNFSRHYFTYKDHIETSKVYQIMKRMPKGGALHVHSMFVLDADYLLQITYEDHLYACYKEDELIKFHFGVSSEPCPSGNWILVSDLRFASQNVNEFDYEIKRSLQLFSEDIDPNTSVDEVWSRFKKADRLIKNLITYRPVREKYIYDTFQKLYDDNVLYVEMRSGVHLLYELNGTIHDGAYFIKLHENITNRFIKEYPDFIGMKFILTKYRQNSEEVIGNAINLTIQLKNQFPHMVEGFDLVGQEDKGKPLKDFLPELLRAKGSINFYFHAGETNWYGTSSDDNLFDAILLGTKRIGHGFALTKHPVLLNMVIEKQIAVEVNVVSNAVLALVDDVRNHPLAPLLALGVPVVLSSDDPGVWGAEPLSHDFYIAFVAVASKRADLRLLKQLAINSIRYSALENNRKVRFLKVFMKRWTTFLRYVVKNYSLQ